MWVKLARRKTALSRVWQGGANRQRTIEESAEHGDAF
jgi:hypothetical protein